MTKYAGRNHLVAMGNADGPPETFTTIANTRSTGLSITVEGIDVTDKGSTDQWRELIEGGVRSAEVSISGPMSDAATLALMKVRAKNGSINNYRITNGKGDVWQGAFQVQGLENAGEYNADETYSFKLASAGPLTYTAAA